MPKKILTTSAYLLLILLTIVLAFQEISTSTYAAESARSSEVSAVSDRTPPPVPTGLQLTLDGNGVKATWQLSSIELPASYNLYRSNNIITSTTGLAPVATAITINATDPAPSSSMRFYAVTALDALGNESAPSDTVEITFPVAPVKNLILTRLDDGKPTLTWEASESNIQGYFIYRNGSRINQTPTISTTYTDGYYSGGVVRYGISEVDNLGNESPVKEVTLPDLSIGLKQGTTLRRGVLETIPIIVGWAAPTNTNGGLTIDSITLKIGSLPESTLTGPFTLNSTVPLEIQKVAATEANAPSQIAVPVTAILNPSPGTAIKITKTSIANVMASSTALEIYNEPLIRGGQAKVRLKVNNLGSARMEFLTSQNNTTTSQVKISLKDQDGNLLSQGYLDQRIGSLIVNSGNYATARLNPGESILTDPITFSVPTSAPYKVIIEAEIQSAYYHYNQTDQVTAPGLKQTIETTITETSYRAVAATDKTIYKQGEAVKITGRAISNQLSAMSEQPMPNVPVKLGISVKGFDRYYTVNTDNNGNFTYTFTPGINEAGTYSIWAVHPDINDRTIQAQFSIVGLDMTPILANIKMAKNSSYDIPVTLKNPGDTALANLTFTTASSAGITAGVINPGDTTLTAGETQNISFRITADSTAGDIGYATLTVSALPSLTTDHSPLTTVLDANITLIQAIPIISTTPSYIDTGLKRGTQRIETFTITNTGLETLKNARLEGPSTSWMVLTNDRNIGDIKPGSSVSIGLLLKPSETLAQGIYDDRIVIYSDNHIPYTFNIQATVTSSAIGSVMFDVLNELMEDVSGATITIQHQLLTELMYTIKTGTDGTVSLFDIPEGRYSFNVTAPGHKSYSGSFTIQPGITTTVPIGLQVTLVDIQWSVVPITIQDRYEIKITQTFQTNVPVPVLITEPAGINIPEMQPGQIYNGEFTVTNYGLIQVDDVHIQFPATFLDYDIEILANIPARINAMQKITVPYRITKRQTTAYLTTPSPLVGEGWGEGAISHYSTLLEEVKGFGGSCVTSFSITITGAYVICPNTPQQSTRQTSTGPTIGIPTSCGGTGGTGGGGTGGYVGGGGTYTGGGGGTGGQGGGGWMPGGSPTIIAGEQCFNPPPPCKNKCGCGAGGSGGSGGPGGGGGPGPDVPCGSQVILSAGTYTFDVTDLKIPSRGLPIEWQRTYRSNRIIQKETGWIFGEPIDSPIGYGWFSPYFAKIEGDSYISGDGRYFFFKKDANGNYLTDTEAGLSLKKTTTGYELKEIGANTSTFNAEGKLTSIKDPRGNTLTLNYDTNGNLTSIKDATGRTVLTFTYDVNNHISTITDMAGRTTTYEYDTMGNLIKVIDAGGNIFTYTYNTYHGILTKTNPLNETFTIEYQYPDRGITSKVTDPIGTELIQQGKTPEGHQMLFTYDFANLTFYHTDYSGRKFKTTFNDKGKPTSREEIQNSTSTPTGKIEYLANNTEKITDSAGNITTVQKNEWGNVIRRVDGEGNEIKYTYTTDNKPLTITDPLGTVTRYEYDAYGNKIKETQAAGTTEESITTYTYDQYGQLTSTTKGGATTSYAYDTNGNLIEIKDAMNNTTTMTYDEAGNVLTITDPNNNKTEFTYDTMNNRLTQKDPEGNITTFTYNAANRMTTSKDPKGNITTYETDYKGRITSIKDTLNNITKMVYDEAGNLTEKIDPQGNKTTMTYDSQNRLITITDPEGNTTRYEYTTSGTTTCTSCNAGASRTNPGKIIDPLNNETNFTFDKNGRITGITDPMSYLSSMAYDAGGRVTSKIDTNGNTTKYQYDALGRVTKQIDANNGDTTFNYDQRGNLLTVTDANGTTTTYQYDLANRKTKETRPMGQTEEFIYDPAGSQKTKKDSNGQITTYTYNKKKQLIETTYSDGKKDTFAYDQNGNLISYTGNGISGTITYDAMNRKVSETMNYGIFQKTYSSGYDNTGNKATFTSPENTTYTYTYNKNRQLKSIAFDGKTINYDYQWNRLIKTTLPNGITTDNTYNANSWLTHITAKSTSSTIIDYNYTFDKTGNILAKNTERGIYNYTYDTLSRLTQAINPTLPQETYSYDKVGNRLTSQEASNWAYNANNELITYNNTSLTYDQNGNTIQETKNSQTTKYIYNTANRLERVELTDGRIAIYTYDPFGRRIKKDINGQVTYYLYSDEGLIGEYDANGNLKKAYGWRPSNTWGTNPVFMLEGGNYYFYHNDHLGTSQKMTDGFGNVVWSANYTAFGEAVVDISSTITNNLRFPGQYYDVETGKHYNYFRDYDPRIGRYVEADPLGIEGGINLFTYARNNASRFMDILGMACKEISRVQIPSMQSSDPIYSYERERKWNYKTSVVESSDICYCMYESTSKIIADVYRQYDFEFEVTYECKGVCGKTTTKKERETIPALNPVFEKIRTEPAPYKMEMRWGFTTDFIHCSCEPPPWQKN